MLKFDEVSKGNGFVRTKIVDLSIFAKPSFQGGSTDLLHFASFFGAPVMAFGPATPLQTCLQ